MSVVRPSTKMGTNCKILTTSFASAQAMSDDVVITLVKAGLDETLIIDKINSMACGYDVSTEKLIALKRSGVSDAILSVLVRRCATVNQQRGVSRDSKVKRWRGSHNPPLTCFHYRIVCRLVYQVSSLV